jgi:hypothetical protein
MHISAEEGEGNLAAKLLLWARFAVVVTSEATSELPLLECLKLRLHCK